MYVNRTGGKITTVCPGFVAGMAEEQIADDDPELLAYLHPPVPIPPLPRLTFWLAAAEIGVTKAAIRAHIDAMPEGLAKIQAQAYLDDALVYRREDPLLIAMAAAEGITEPELDALWAWASAAYP
ncbi:hypothetical protein [Rhizobium sp. CECT 9324]|uniref:hypothetical protein n=1 Tax=Rhizobium sp. CECT 9324 TaxID=2845820 RepID=UPI001E4A6826|nr:hypothetical protein [Rhizobium sp. CECT 9324]CAH0339567.1 hypothetical protein RHI9324_01218 [Rhizobium sp. CECT 9324]